MRARIDHIKPFCRREFGTKPKPEEFGPNSPGPSGFRLAANHLSGGFVRWGRIGPATFLVDCLAFRETELVQYDQISL
jgi:hypothetical protein